MSVSLPVSVAEFARVRGLVWSVTSCARVLVLLNSKNADAKRRVHERELVRIRVANRLSSGGDAEYRSGKHEVGFKTCGLFITLLLPQY